MVPRLGHPRLDAVGMLRLDAAVMRMPSRYWMHRLRHGRASRAADLRVIGRAFVHMRVLADRRLSRRLLRVGAALILLPSALHATRNRAQLPAQRAVATVEGQVVDPGGGGIRDADVRLVGTTRHVLTDFDGRFRFIDAPDGPLVLQVRRLGFRPESTAVDSARGQSRPTVTIRLTPIAQQLSAVTIDARHEAFDSRLAGFERRRALNVGHFITRERIDRQNSANLTDLLREVPGVRVGTLTGMDHAVRIRGSRCPPLVWIDGFPARAAELDLDMMDPTTVEGVEIYSSGSSVPQEFLGNGAEAACGVIVIWSRPARSKRTRERPSPSPAKSVDLESLVQSGAVFAASQVEVRALPDSGTLAPEYPDSLWRAGAEGRVVLEFVVDSTGVVEERTIRVVVATHALLAESARRAVTGAHFTPASLAGRHVRQIVQAPFEFVIDRKPVSEPRMSKF